MAKSELRVIRRHATKSNPINEPSGYAAESVTVDGRCPGADLQVFRLIDEPSADDLLALMRTMDGRLPMGSAWARATPTFNDENSVSFAGLVPVMALGERAGLSELISERVRFRSSRVQSARVNPAGKLTSAVAGMAAGADCIDDLDVLRRWDEAVVRWGLRGGHAGANGAGAAPAASEPAVRVAGVAGPA